MDSKGLPFGVPPQHINNNPNPPQVVPDKSVTEAIVNAIPPTEESATPLGDYLKNQNTYPQTPNYMTLPGTPSKPFEVFFQFDEGEPVRMAETRGKFTLELTPYDLHGSLINSDQPLPGFEWHQGGKKFKIFLKRKP